MEPAAVSWHTFAIFVATTFFVSAAPGPNMLMSLSMGLRFGARRAAWCGAGMVAALAGMATVSALGLGALLTASETGFEIARWAGVGYLVWLGVAAWRAPVAEDGARPQAADESEAARGRLFLRGVLVALSNPKALAFMAALFPQFIDPTAPLVPQLAILVAAMTVIEFGWLTAYATGGDRLAARLSGAAAARTLNRLTGGLMIAAGGLLALARRV